MGHPQLPTLIMMDNTTVNGNVNDAIKHRRLHGIDVQYYWLEGRCQQGHFQVYWRHQDENFGDYHTRHHPVEPTLSSTTKTW
eukprot:15043521-Ditylum_brightwellii.AAC.1